MNLLKSFEHYIEQEQLFGRGELVIVALSGGADSVALLRLMIDAGYRCEAAHCNFHLRGDESNRDERFVAELCDRLGVKLHKTDFDTAEYAARQGVSIEMAARELRYNWFEQLRTERGASCIAVAHHKDDSVETILLNLIRGTGIAGLTGIRPKNGHIVRPLLCASRAEITDYLSHIGQEYVTDSTNLVDEYTRNKIRLNIIPMLQEINPAVKESITSCGNSINEALAVYRNGIEEGRRRVTVEGGIDIERLMKEPSPRALLHEMLYPLGFNPRQIGDIFDSLSGQAGRQFRSANGWRAIKDRSLLIVEKEEMTKDSLPSASIKIRKVERTAEYTIPRSKNIFVADADKLNGELTLRHWQRGDWFVPFGMKGRKLVSDYMTDRKFSIAQKEEQLLLCCGDRIAWLVDERSDDRFRVDDETKRIFEITIE
jgi:tRNA(Ile)-lysidine synthase